jgi:hypothetical protein
MDSDLDEARKRIENIASHLPTSISVASLGVLSKAPYLLLSTREALIWRTEELARCACDMLERNDVAAGILLTRAVIESAAFVWRLKELLETRHQYSTAALHDTLRRMHLGWKNDPEFDPEFPEKINILTIIAHMDKKLPGVKARYDHLSEFAHPNWSGVAGLFSSTDYQNYSTDFGRGLRTSGQKENASILLATSLDLFEYAYNSISDTLPEFLEELRLSEAANSSKNDVKEN